MGSESTPTDTLGPTVVTGQSVLGWEPGVGASGGGGGVWPVPSACCRFVSLLEGSRSSVSSHSSGPSHLLTLHTVTVSAARHLRLVCCDDKTVVKKGQRGRGVVEDYFPTISL